MACIDDTEFSYLSDGINVLSVQLHAKSSKLDDNDLLSPIGIHAFLILICQDPWFRKKDCLTELFNINEVIHTVDHYRDLLTILCRVKDLQIANTSFTNQCSTIQDVFKKRLGDNFASEINSLDFTNRGIAAERVNAWFTHRTAKKISRFCDLKEDVSLAFLNAMHIEGKWTQMFDEQQTVPGKFHLHGQNTVDVPMMRKTGEFYFQNCEHTGVKILKLPLAGSNISLVIILPDGDTDINEVKERINYQHLTDHMTTEQVDVSLPKFKIDNEVELSPYLKEMGLEDIFNANMFGMVDGESLTCGDIKQRIVLDVSEKSLDVAAGTACTLTKTSDENVIPKDGLVIYEVKMSTEISNRFAKTKVIWKVKNNNTTAEDAAFKVVLTETAFITEFVMEIQGNCYKSYIKEKKEAKDIYNKAVAHGQSAGLVEADTRNSKEFTVSVNLEPDSVAVFSLIYEEMLQRLHDRYELVLNICPGQIVEDLSVEVNINESRPLKFVKTQPLRSGNDMNTTEFVKYLEPMADIKTINSKTASIKFRPDVARQKKMTHYLGNKTNEGLYGQFVVLYDVEREPLDGEVLLQDGYFVHFFAPNDLDPLPKHVVFVLDTSGSMSGRKIEQLKDAMTNILNDLRKEDMLSIVEFNDNVVVWDVDSKKSTSLTDDEIKDFREPFAYLKKCILANPQYVTDSIRAKAKEVVQEIRADGCTFMIGGLETGLHLVKIGQQVNQDKEERLQPVIVFLTDGEPNVGIESTDKIMELVTLLNTRDKVPIFSLSFGDDADKNFLRKLSLRNWGFSRHIYEAADASLQLQEFYKQISCPLLHDINFKYDAMAQEVTRTWFPIYFRGSELVVAGKYEEQNFPTTIDCCGPCGPMVIRSATQRPVTSVERLWAYLTVKQLLDERETSENPAELTKRAVNLAVKYSFVTDVTSLVVVKPKETTTAHTSPPPNIVNERLDCTLEFDGGNTAKGLNYMDCTDCIATEDENDAVSMGNNVRFHGAVLRAVKRNEEFIAHRPFLIMLQYEQGDNIVILFQGQVHHPNY